MRRNATSTVASSGKRGAGWKKIGSLAGDTALILVLHLKLDYLMVVKRTLNNIILAVLLSGVCMIGQAGQHKDSGFVPVVSHTSFAVAGNEKCPPSDSGPQFTQGKALQLNPRVDVSSEAILTSDRPALPSILICLLVDPLVNQFTQGIYLRYWARDPPSA